MATGIVCPLGSCKSTGKVPDTGLKEAGKGYIEYVTEKNKLEIFKAADIKSQNNRKMIEDLTNYILKKTINTKTTFKTNLLVLCKIENVTLLHTKVEWSHQLCPDKDFMERRKVYEFVD